MKTEFLSVRSRTVTVKISIREESCVNVWRMSQKIFFLNKKRLKEKGKGEGRGRHHHL